jgi:hypothetical protein
LYKPIPSSICLDQEANEQKKQRVIYDGFPWSKRNWPLILLQKNALTISNCR